VIGPEKQPILIIDDDKGAREALSEFLKICGYPVTCAENGQAALSAIQRRPPSLILLDLMMPIVDGRSFLTLAQRNRRLKNIPIIISTAYPELRTEGAAAVLTKPIRPDKLLRLIRQFV
jgi:CheY-like chemotaxis protein